MSKDASQFVYLTCRTGAETAVKTEVARTEPAWRFSFSRPGFVTYKLPADQSTTEKRLAEKSWTFAHAHGISVGRVAGESLEALSQQVWEHPGIRPLLESGGFADLHVWQLREPDEDATSTVVELPLCDAIQIAVRLAAPPESKLQSELQIAESPVEDEQSAAEDTAKRRNRRPAPRNSRVLDIVVLAPGEWWIGYHLAMRKHDRWPGGAIPVVMPERAVSRAYLKMQEALAWSDLPLVAEDECVEIGCAPGGASQALLERGLYVTGIDPAEVDEAVLAHPRFRHLKKRGRDVRKKEFEGVRWLAADMNIAPEATLEEIEAIVTHPGIAIRGMVLTLKFSTWKQAERVPEFVEQVRGWGFRDVRTRQLISGGQEICLVALKRKALRRVAGKTRKTSKTRSASNKPTRRADGPHPLPRRPHF